MTRINTLSVLATLKEPPPLSVWTMTMAILGAVFGATSSMTVKDDVRMTLRRPVR